MLKRLALLSSLLLAACAASAAVVRTPTEGGRPRLVVLISIDQYRADFIQRFQDLYLPARRDGQVGGFRYLQSRGAWYPDCRYSYHRTVTAAGHATLGTGAEPYLHGVVGNGWFDRASGKPVYCVADPNTQVVGAESGSTEKPMSAATLLTTTVADELEAATGGRSRTVSLSMKDRAAILLAGHRADTVVWFDEGTGGWVSSVYYCPQRRLPLWVQEFNASKVADRMRQKPWEPSVGPAALERVQGLKGTTPAFSHALTGKDYGPFITSPLGNAFLFEATKQAVRAEEMGKDDIPDMLTINLASNDYVGHRYGPDSAEVLDISVQTDRQLADFFNYLEREVPGGLAAVTIALSADHGVACVPEVNAAARVPASRAVAPFLLSTVEKALDAKVGAADWIASSENGELYFSAAALAKYPKTERSRLEEIVDEALRGVPGVYATIGRTAVMRGQAPRTALGDRVSRGMHPTRSGDVALILDPQWLAGALPVGTGTSHGSPFVYDTHVPMLVAGFGMRPGTYGAPTTPAQLAPTLSFLLGVARPSGADQPLLPGLEGVR